MKKLVIGLVAHVDAGKTTLSESLLYLAGAIRNQGRVDHQDAFLDFDDQERRRGMTIYSKISRLTHKDTEMTFIDTPGHVDFSGEMERSLSILDYAVLIISGTDGIQPHTKTIARLLKEARIPTFIFMNKMDITHLTKDELLTNLKTLYPNAVDWQAQDYEDMAMGSEALLEEYMDTNTLSQESLITAIQSADLYPVFFGSALKNNQTDVLLDALSDLTLPVKDQEAFGVRVYKIAHDGTERLTFMRLYGGTLKVRDSIGDEKINTIRMYQGQRYDTVNEATAGDVVAVTGLKEPQAGDALGSAPARDTHIEPLMQYQLHLPDNDNKTQMLANLTKLGEEEPLLHLDIQDGDHIEVSLMGEVQIEILTQLIKDRFGEDVTIDNKRITYKETITTPVEGVGHFEPLRHYAEVHVLLEPLPAGSGLVFENKCQNTLPTHFQRLIMTHMKERTHRGVLIGAPITDMKITLLGGKGHEKHTQGGDFRQALYRAIRMGLMMTESVVLEPYMHYTLTVPSSSMSRVYFDFDAYDAPVLKDDNGTTAVFEGQAPMAFLSGYQKEVINYTKGEGTISLYDAFYAPAINQEEIIASHPYDPEKDLRNPTGSVFCTHGSGYYVPYDMVPEKMHLDWFTKEKEPVYHSAPRRYNISDEEVMRVYENTYGKVETRLNAQTKPVQTEKVPAATVKVKPECVLVDGYNVIFAWDELHKMAEDSLAIARDHLIEYMADYQGWRGCTLIIVFDAYKVPGHAGETLKSGNIHIVYTREAQTADAYIEAATKTMAEEYNVTVVTSDYMEQKIILGHGAMRMSARELRNDWAYRSKEGMDGISAGSSFIKKNH